MTEVVIAVSALFLGGGFLLYVRHGRAKKAGLLQPGKEKGASMNWRAFDPKQETTVYVVKKKGRGKPAAEVAVEDLEKESVWVFLPKGRRKPGWKKIIHRG